MLAVYAIVNGNQNGWTSAETLGLLGGAVALLALFLAIESRVEAPLVPLGDLPACATSRPRTSSACCGPRRCSRGSSSRRSTSSSCSATARSKVGLAFLPANLIMGAFSLGLSAKLVMRFGIERPLATGLLLAAGRARALRARAGRRQLRASTCSRA